ncbi:MAG TPA: hypothetical protein VF453_06675 [Burkholderiaceae bacterium]
MRTTNDEPVTMAERYSGAIESSNLRVRETAGDVDLLVAAGLAGNCLAGALLRLQVEYDTVRGEHRAAEARLRAAEIDAARQKGDFVDEDGVVLSTAEQRASAINSAAQAQALTDHVMIIATLPSLRRTKEMLGHFALARARELRFVLPTERILRLAGAALDVFLSPQCRECRGIGFTGALQRGEPQKRCRACKATGSRRYSVGKDEIGRAFVFALLLDLSDLVDTAAASLARQRRAVREAKAMLLRAEAAGSGAVG